MEKKQNFPSHAGLSGKALIASLFIISGILLFARNVGWITYDLFSIVVSWHSLLIVLGIYTMTHRHYLSGSILTLIGIYFLVEGLSWLPENSHFRSFLLLADYLCQILKYFLEAFQEFLCFIHAEAQRRQQAKYIRTAYTGEYMLLFQ